MTEYSEARLYKAQWIALWSNLAWLKNYDLYTVIISPFTRSIFSQTKRGPYKRASLYYQVDESGVLVQPRPDDARVDGHRLHVEVVEPLLEGPREHDLRRLGVAVSALGTVELPEIAKSVQTLRLIHFGLSSNLKRPKLMRRE